MNHFSDDQLLDAYYGQADPELRLHLNECPECRSSLERLREVLDLVRDYPIPERGPSYGGEVWARVLPNLSLARPRRNWVRWWTWAPALTVLFAVAFLAGMFTQRNRQLPGISAIERERVLLIAMSEHLERSQIVLTQVANATPSGIDLSDERNRARDLLGENRLLRETAQRAGDASDAMLLDDLERVLLEIANSASGISSDDLQALQSRIESEGLLFKVRITSTHDRHKGQKL